jgi:hypothetical protein
VDGKSHCFAQEKFTTWYAGEYAFIEGPSNIKKELFKRGPIACMMRTTDNFVFNYKGGLYYEKHFFPQIINHAVNIVGWVKEKYTGIEYWVVRNSWGTHWGRSGYFFMKMHGDNLFLGKDCWWAVPTDQKP